MAGLTTSLCALFALVIWIFAKSYGVLILYALVGGTVAGTFWATAAPVAVEVVGLRDLPAALNLEWLVIVLPCTFSQPTALQIASNTGGYLGTQLFVAVMYMAAALCVLLLRRWKIDQLKEIARRENDHPNGISMAESDLGANEDIARPAERRTQWKEFWKWRKI
ncbi:MAG: hypothetical protein L6R42_011052 [Xanthoria sp. 1 TBL-2021]|nr:MAG: hypothetical protein L6R42_011052 [Xanthoria sp. 1 TBL-2021]